MTGPSKTTANKNQPEPAPGVRRVRLFRNGRSQAIRIPREFEFDGEAVDIHREGDRLIIEPPRSNVKALLALLATMKPIDEDISIPDELLPLDDGPDFGPNDDADPQTR
jgi:antitoxin VapB